MLHEIPSHKRRNVAMMEIAYNIAYYHHLLGDQHKNLMSSSSFQGLSEYKVLLNSDVVLEIKRPQTLFHTQTIRQIDIF